jgi:hypothetical protein
MMEARLPEILRDSSTLHCKPGAILGNVIKPPSIDSEDHTGRGSTGNPVGRARIAQVG